MEDQGHSDQKNQQKPSNSNLRYSQLGFQMLVAIGLAAWGGYALDKKLELDFPAFLLTFIFIAFGASMYMLYKALND